MKFGDIATAVASLFLITVLISYPLESVLISILGLNLAPTIGALISVLLGGLLVGYVFTGKTDDGRKEVLVKISIFFTVLMLFSIVLNNAVLGEYFTNWVQETYMESNPTTSLTTFEWFLIGGLFIGSQMFMNAIILFVFSLIGLFAGSRLRRWILLETGTIALNRRIDLIVVWTANLINVIMTLLFIVRISNLPQVENILGIVAMIMGFGLGYIAFFNWRNNRNKWETYLLIPIFLFFIVELILDYILNFDFRSTPLVGPYILFYYVALWGLIGYAFRFNKKWGFLTLATYFLNMTLSVLQHFV
jgi:hypothetical protein